MLTALTSLVTVVLSCEVILFSMLVQVCMHSAILITEGEKLVIS